MHQLLGLFEVMLLRFDLLVWLEYFQVDTQQWEHQI